MNIQPKVENFLQFVVIFLKEKIRPKAIQILELKMVEEIVKKIVLHTFWN